MITERFYSQFSDQLYFHDVLNSQQWACSTTMLSIIIYVLDILELDTVIFTSYGVSMYEVSALHFIFVSYEKDPPPLLKGNGKSRVIAFAYRIPSCGVPCL